MTAALMFLLGLAIGVIAGAMVAWISYLRQGEAP